MKPSGTSFAKLNHLQLREQEAINRERKRFEDEGDIRSRQAAQRQKEKFDHIPSTGYGNGKNAQKSENDDVEITVFVRECEPDGHMFKMVEQAGKMSHPRDRTTHSNEAQLTTTNTKLGVVPQYLQKRKAEMEAEKDAMLREAELQREAAQYPPGHRPLSEDERKEILLKLSQRRRELENEIGRLPMRYDTQAIKQRRSQLDTELAENEDAVRKFSSKKQLFVPC